MRFYRYETLARVHTTTGYQLVEVENCDPQAPHLRGAGIRFFDFCEVAYTTQPGTAIRNYLMPKRSSWDPEVSYRQQDWQLNGWHRAYLSPQTYFVGRVISLAEALSRVYEAEFQRVVKALTCEGNGGLILLTTGELLPYDDDDQIIEPLPEAWIADVLDHVYVDPSWFVHA